MNTAKFSYNPKRHSLLYLTRKDDFIVEEYDIKKRKIIKTYPLSYSIINPKDLCYMQIWMHLMLIL